MEEDKKYSAVVYTDGGCKHPGHIGWGGHGYIFENIPAKKEVKAEGWLITSKGYKQLGFKNNDTEFLVTPVKYIDCIGSDKELGTNNTAELSAAIQVLEKLYSENILDVCIISDSEYVNKGMTTWLQGWIKNNWIKSDGRPVSNKDLWLSMNDIITKIKAKEGTVVVEWIKGHSNNLGNNLADTLASIGINYSAKEETQNTHNFSDIKGYWKVNIERHPYLNFKRIYFNTSDQFNLPGMYYQADPGTNELYIGKRLAETGYSVVRLKDIDPIIEHVTNKQIEVCKNSVGIHMLKADRLFSKNIYKYIKEFGSEALYTNKRNSNLSFVDNEPLIAEFNPTGLSLRAIDNFNLLEELLGKFILHKDDTKVLLNDVFKLMVHDITDEFFNEQTVKKKTKVLLDPKFVVGFKDMMLEISREDTMCKVPVVLGLDLPVRNSLKKLEGLNTSIKMLTWSEAKKTFRYAFIIESDLGIGIWSNFYADKIFIT